MKVSFARLWAILMLLELCVLFVANHRSLEVINVAEDESIRPLKTSSKHGPQRQLRRSGALSKPLETNDKGTRRSPLRYLFGMQAGGLGASAVSDTTTRLLVHLHIGKTGGTSLDAIGPSLARDSDRQFIGNKHFDWSFINKLPPDKTDVVMMLRNPVARAVSHFYFSKTLSWTADQKMRNLELRDYLQDKEALMQTRDLWFDGQAAVSWLTGTHLAKWVGVKAEEQDEREQIASNATSMCLLAADRLDETLWFGIIEDLPRSMELLQYALGLSWLPEFPTSNSAKHKYPEPAEREKLVLASLMPQDLWLYEYSKRLFEARYQAMKTGTFLQPQRPPFPDTWSCKSNRTYLDCVEGPLKGSFDYKSPPNAQRTRKKRMSMHAGHARLGVPRI